MKNLILSTLLIMLISSCGKEKCDGSIIGNWQNQENSLSYTMEFTENGTYILTNGTTGTYTLDNEIIEMQDSYCGTIIGRYKICVSSGILSYDKQNDFCSARSENMLRDVWIKL